jgi:hypothetical protein
MEVTPCAEAPHDESILISETLTHEDWQTVRVIPIEQPTPT